MKTITFFSTLLLIATLTISGCSKLDDKELGFTEYTGIKLDTITFEHSMKGWELYSWPDSAEWKYSLMVGTNAVKMYSQITTNPLCVIGEDSLKTLLYKLPSNEEIIWLGKIWLASTWQTSEIGNLSLPPREIQIEIKEFCDSRNLKLTFEE